MMYRSRHIYILMAGLINIAMGLHFAWRDKLWRKRLQAAGSAFMLIAPFALIAAFFYEPIAGVLQKSITTPAVVSLFIGTLLHMIAGARQEKEIASSEQTGPEESAKAVAS
jgi:multisubunit Na+/H+ antiporter MnhG subunit